MKSLKLKRFCLLSLLFAGSAFATGTLPAKDPYPTIAEPTPAQVASRREGAPAVAIPTESYSYYAVRGFSDGASSFETKMSDTDPKGDSSLAFCHSDKWSAACLTGLIIYRCGQYTFPFTPYGCALAATAFVGSLDMQRINVVIEGTSYSLPVIFTTRLERLIQNHSVQNDIWSLRTLLVSAAKSKSKFDLWEWTRAMNNGNYDKTLETLAVLMQDTSGVAIQINYLKSVAKARKFTPATLKAIDDLEEVNYQLNSEILADENWRAWLQLYPRTKKIQEDSTPLIYHFYPMSLTARWLQLGGFGNRLASFIPFLFNTEYLNQTLDPMAWPLHHPKPFQIDSDWKKWKMRDMYGGYAGALWGVQKTANLPGLVPFETTYAKAPFETMRHHFWSMPNP